MTETYISNSKGHEYREQLEDQGQTDRVDLVMRDGLTVRLRVYRAPKNSPLDLERALSAFRKAGD